MAERRRPGQLISPPAPRATQLYLSNDAPIDMEASLHDDDSFAPIPEIMADKWSDLALEPIRKDLSRTRSAQSNAVLDVNSKGNQ